MFLFPLIIKVTRINKTDLDILMHSTLFVYIFMVQIILFSILHHNTLHAQASPILVYGLLLLSSSEQLLYDMHERHSFVAATYFSDAFLALHSTFTVNHTT